MEIVHHPLRQRWDALDSLRGIFALCVVLFHFRTTGYIGGATFFRHGWLAVDFFFVLSGFVITAAYGKELAKGLNISQFVVLRLFRIYPLHLLMILAFIALELPNLYAYSTGHSERPPFSGTRPLEALPLNLLLIQIFGIYDGPTWNIPSWSIAAEFWIYIVAALVFAKRGWPRLWIFTALIAASTLALALRGRPYLDVTYEFSIVRCALGFSLGVLVHTIWARLSTSTYAGLPPYVHSLMSCGALMLAVFGIYLLASGLSTLLMPFIFALFILSLAFKKGWLHTSLSHPVLIWLGRISFSVYMVHLFIHVLIFNLLPKAGLPINLLYVDRFMSGGYLLTQLAGAKWAVDLATIGMLALVIGVAQLCFKYVEQPCNGFARRLYRADRRSPSLARSAS